MSQQSTGTVLDAIIEGVRADLAERREHVGLDELRRAVARHGRRPEVVIGLVAALLLVLLVAKGGARVFTRLSWATVLGLFALSLGLSWWWTPRDPSAYFVTPTRIFQLMLGALVALGARARALVEPSDRDQRRAVDVAPQDRVARGQAGDLLFAAIALGAGHGRAPSSRSRTVAGSSPGLLLPSRPTVVGAPSSEFRTDSSAASTTASKSGSRARPATRSPGTARPARSVWAVV